MCEDLRLPEPAALGLTSTIKAASEYRSVFIPVKCQSTFFPPYTGSYEHLIGFLDVLHKAAA